MGVNPLEPSSTSSCPAAAAIWWAGPVIGAFNLIPVLPLDGGNIVTYGLDRLVPGRARRYMLYFSIAVTLAGAVVLVGNRLPRIRPVHRVPADHAAADAQRRQAAEGAPLGLGGRRRGAARRQAAQGPPDAARCAQPSAADRRRPRSRSSPRPSAALIDLLPDPLPHGDPGNEYVLANLLLTTRRFDDAAHYAAGSFGRHPNTLSAAIVARAAGALGDQATAIGWLQTAADAGTSTAGLATTIDRAPELTEVRLHPDVVAIRRSLAPIT